MLKPHIKPRPKTGDANSYYVWLGGVMHKVMIPGCLQAVTHRHPLTLLGEEIRRLKAPSR